MWHPLITPKKGVLAFISIEGLFYKFPLQKSKGYFCKYAQNQKKTLKIQKNSRKISKLRNLLSHKIQLLFL